MKRIKAIIFDLDGTIANTLSLCIQAFRQAVEPLVMRSITDEEIIATFGPSEEGTIMALAPDHYHKGVADYLQFYESLHEMCPKLFDGMEELLTFLKSKSVRIAMVTGKGIHSTNISLRQFNVTHFFDFIETGSPARPRKAEGIQDVLNQWKDLRKDEVIYVGDSPGDIEASRKVGIAVIAAAWADAAEPEKLKELQPDEIFYSVGDFATWIHDRIR